MFRYRFFNGLKIFIAGSLGILGAFFLQHSVPAVSWWLSLPFFVFIFSGVFGFRGRHLFVISIFLSVAIVLAWFLLGVAIPPVIYLLLFVITFAWSGNAIYERVPLFLSSRLVVTKLASIIPSDTTFIDIGCGTGTVLFALAKKRPDLVLTGIENAWFPYLIARFKAIFQPRVHICYGSFWTLNWHNYDVIYCYLSSEPMQKVWKKFCNEATPQAVLISNTFLITGQTAQHMYDSGDIIGSRLYVWENSARSS